MIIFNTSQYMSIGGNYFTSRYSHHCSMISHSAASLSYQLFLIQFEIQAKIFCKWHFLKLQYIFQGFVIKTCANERILFFFSSEKNFEVYFSNDYINRQQNFSSYFVYKKCLAKFCILLYFSTILFYYIFHFTKKKISFYKIFILQQILVIYK